ncbi:MAG: hypothetical protein F6K47_34530 [Symploca sp. SIO2E6]|nr:hypothetical protein [Symploca sp. SIO2E6]
MGIGNWELGMENGELLFLYATTGSYDEAIANCSASILLANCELSNGIRGEIC